MAKYTDRDLEILSDALAEAACAVMRMFDMMGFTQRQAIVALKVAAYYGEQILDGKAHEDIARTMHDYYIMELKKLDGEEPTVH